MADFRGVAVVIGADIHSNKAKTRFRHAQSPADTVEFVADSQLVDLAVPEDNLATIVDENGAIVDVCSVLFGQAAADIYSVLTRQITKEVTPRPRNGRGFALSGRMRPPEIQRFRQQDNLTPLLGSLPHHGRRPFEVPLCFAALH